MTDKTQENERIAFEIADWAIDEKLVPIKERCQSMIIEALSAKDTLYQVEIAKKEATIKKLREALEKISMSIFLTDCQNFAQEALADQEIKKGDGE